MTLPEYKTVETRSGIGYEHNVVHRLGGQIVSESYHFNGILHHETSHAYVRYVEGVVLYKEWWINGKPLLWTESVGDLKTYKSLKKEFLETHTYEDIVKLNAKEVFSLKELLVLSKITK